MSLADLYRANAAQCRADAEKPDCRIRDWLLAAAARYDELAACSLLRSQDTAGEVPPSS